MPYMRVAARPLSLATRRARRLRVEQALAENPRRKKKLKPWTFVKRKRGAILVGGGLTLLKGALGAGASVAVKAASKAAGVSVNKKKHQVEVLKASRYYGRHATGWVVLVDGYPVLHGDKMDAERIAARFRSNPRASRARFGRTRIASPKEFDPRSLRTITPGSGRHKLVVGCPKGEYRGGRCKVGTEVQSVLRAKENEWAKNPRLKRFRLLDAAGGILAGAAASSPQEALHGLKASFKREKRRWPRKYKLVQVTTAPLFKAGGPSPRKGAGRQPPPGRLETPGVVRFEKAIEKRFGAKWPGGVRFKWFAAEKRNPEESARRIYEYLFHQQAAGKLKGTAHLEKGPGGTVSAMVLSKDGTATSVESIEEAKAIVSGRFKRNAEPDYHEWRHRQETAFARDAFKAGNREKGYAHLGAAGAHADSIRHNPGIDPLKGARRARGAEYEGDELGLIMAYEAGELDDETVIGLFARLIKTGLVWKLQGHYGRTARQLMEAGYISINGDILAQPNPRTTWHRKALKRYEAEHRRARNKDDKSYTAGKVMAEQFALDAPQANPLLMVVPNPAKRIGSQALEPLAETEYRLIGRKRGVAILWDPSEKKLEAWGASKYFAEYAIGIGNTAYEFLRTVSQKEAEQLLSVRLRPGVSTCNPQNPAKRRKKKNRKPSLLEREFEIPVSPRHLAGTGKKEEMPFAKLPEVAQRKLEIPLENPDMAALMKHPDFAKGIKLHQELHGCGPENVERLMLPVGGKKNLGRVFMVALGKAPSESYLVTNRRSVKKKGQIYVHPYDRMPVKAVDVTGRFIATLPGSHAVKKGAGQDQAWING